MNVAAEMTKKTTHKAGKSTKTGSSETTMCRLYSWMVAVKHLIQVVLAGA